MPRATYESKATEFLRDLVSWLQEHMSDAFEVTYQGRSKSLVEWATGNPPPALSGSASQSAINFRDLVNTVAGFILSRPFSGPGARVSLLLGSDHGPEPRASRQDALRAIAGQTRTKQATAVLDALELLDGERIDPYRSRYAKHLLQLAEEQGTWPGCEPLRAHRRGLRRRVLRAG